MMDDLRSVLVETPDPGGGKVEDDKVGAGDIGLVLTLLTLYLQAVIYCLNLEFRKARKIFFSAIFVLLSLSVCQISDKKSEISNSEFKRNHLLAVIINN